MADTDDQLTSADYEALADSYEREPPRRDERLGEPVLDIGAGLRRGAGDPEALRRRAVEG